MTRLVFTFILLLFGITFSLACSCVPDYASPCEVLENADQNPSENFGVIVELGQSYRNANNRLVYNFTVLETLAGTAPLDTNIIRTGDGADCLEFFDYPAGTQAVWLGTLQLGDLIGHPSFCSDFTSLFPIENNEIEYADLQAQVTRTITLDQLRNRDCGFVLDQQNLQPEDFKYHNTSSTLTILEIPSYSDMSFELYDMTGRMVASFNQLEQDISQLSLGIYTLVAREERPVVIGRFVKGR